MILVTGGAGYIGSHTVKLLRQQGRSVLVLDDLSEGHRQALLGAELAEGSIMDRAFLLRLFAERDISAVFHFAARCYVGESVTDPGKYYRFNAVGTMNLLDAMVGSGVLRLVFSSTYGEPERMPIIETMPQVPVNPYGSSKLVCEWLLRDYQRAHGLASVSLRYFNAAGADPEGELGEDHRPETHLIPLVIRAAMGQGDRGGRGGDWLRGAPCHRRASRGRPSEIGGEQCRDQLSSRLAASLRGDRNHRRDCLELASGSPQRLCR